MRPYLAVAFLWFAGIKSNGQSIQPSPGGVKGVSQWYITDVSSGKPKLRSQLANNVDAILPEQNTLQTDQLNFHPSLKFTEKTQLAITLDRKKFTSASYFTVYRATDTTTENNIWHITKNGATGLVLTTKRMADLNAYHYMNYIDLRLREPKVNVYVQQKPKDIADPFEQTWHIGGKPASPALPITSFSGLLPEIVAYDRVLNGQERLQVASYLAMKYGITLTEPSGTYLNSSGNAVWKGDDYSLYHHNIAALGRDDSSGWVQRMATTSNQPGLLTISTNDTFNNNSFWVWGDNGKPLTPDEKTAGLPQLLKTKWLMVTTGVSKPVATNIVLDTKQIDAPLPAKPVYWLVIDRNGTGNFSHPLTEYIKMTGLDKDEKVHFDGIVWNKYGKGKEAWGLIAAQDLLLSTVISNPDCHTRDQGSLQVKVWGGKLPYQLGVANNTGQVIHQQTINEDVPTVVPNIAAGKYFLKVTDALGGIYTDSFYVNNSDAPQPASIAASYVLPEGGVLKINAADQMPQGLLYSWSGPNNFYSSSPQVNITEVGTYVLTTNRNGCSSQQEVVVTTPPRNVFDGQAIVVYPNPSSGLFTIKISLPEPASVDMAIYDLEGRLLSREKGVGFANYRFTHELTASGVYKLVFWSGESTTTRKLVITR